MTTSRRISLRPMLPGDVPTLAALFVASITDLTGDDYGPAQQIAWAAVADDDEAFGGRLAEGLTLIALIDGVVGGFASLRMPDQLDMLYVAPTAAGQGVATALCDALERLAAARGAAALIVQASDTAQGFFGKRGFTSEQRNTVSLGDEWLGRTTMRKVLDTAGSAKVH